MYGEGRQGGFRPRGGFGGGSDGGVAPVNVGDELDVRIEAVGEKGDGIARKRGFVLFVPNTKEGDEVRIRVTKVLRKVGFADSIGAAQGAINAEPKKERREPRSSAAQDAPQEEAESSPMDSENFGEEETSEGSDENAEDGTEEGN
jgi:predicted RNA-binding protein with TRAM domain